MKPLGLRNCNPGNIRIGAKWKGLKGANKGFCVFESPECGIRAMCRVIRTYQKHYGLTTVKQIVGRWAPAVENDTDQYVRFVTDRTAGRYGINVGNYTHMKLLVEAIIRFENGSQPYSGDVIDEGLKLAGIVPGKETS